MSKAASEKLPEERIHKLLIRLPVSTYEKLRAISYKKRIPISVICREAINKHIESET
jgi:predicted DNA-binding protein